ncbi:MAG: phosphate ABC transporter, permease protein PstA, partial [Bacilli bacterium]
MNISKCKDNIMRGLVYASATFTVGILIVLVVYILIKGIPHITPSLFSIKYTSSNVSLFPALINTLTITALALIFA